MYDSMARSYGVEIKRYTFGNMLKVINTQTLKRGLPTNRMKNGGCSWLVVYQRFHAVGHPHLVVAFCVSIDKVDMDILVGLHIGFSLI